MRAKLVKVHEPGISVLADVVRVTANPGDIYFEVLISQTSNAPIESVLKFGQYHEKEGQ